MKKIRSIILCIPVLLLFALLCISVNAAENVKVLNFVEYANGLVNGHKSATLTTPVVDGRKVLKIVPNPSCTTIKYISVDGYSYSKGGINLEEYRWVAYEYYYASDNPLSVKAEADMLTNGGALTKRLEIKSQTYLKANTWDILLFDFSDVEKYLNPETENHFLSQMHFRPFGSTKSLSVLNADDAFYVSRIIFFKEKPSLSVRTGFLDGYEDGTFRPGKLLTRAEACKMVAACMEIDEENIKGESSFTDVDDDAWYARYVGYLEERNLLPFTGKKLYPDTPITYTELAKLAINSGIAENLGNATLDNTFGSGFSTQVNTQVTRLGAAMLINQLRGTLASDDDIPEDINMLYLDVDREDANFAEIAEASFDHVVSGTKWIYASEDPLDSLIEKLGDDFLYGYLYKTDEGDKMVEYYDTVEMKRITEIKDTPNMNLSGKNVIYVSQSTGNDSNNGRSEESPVKTLEKANSLVKSGWVMALKRGDLWRERIISVEGVTYTAYGTGDKPKIYGSPENGADQNKWTLVYENKETGALIWKYYREDLLDVGTMVFDDGAGFAMKEVPSCVGADYYVRGQENLPVESRTPYDYTVELDKNLEFFHAANSVVVKNSSIGDYIDISKSVGPLYLRCDNGNPGKVFTSIEFNTRGSNIGAKNNVTVDNLCIMYTGVHGISSGTVKNLTVTNCEIGWIGGSIQGYTANGNTKRTATRLGNGVEVYGGCDGYTIDNCYVYQCYDAGVTHQYSDLSKGNCSMLDVTYSNNVITECVYSIEYFLGSDTEGVYERYGDNILFENNLMRRAGYGFGSFRPDGHNQRHVRSSSRDNPFTNYRMINNVFDRSVQDLIYANTPYKECTPVMSGNVYIQGVGNELYHIGTMTAKTDLNSVKKIKNDLGDDTGAMYYVKYIPYYVYDYTPSRSYPVTDSDRT